MSHADLLGQLLPPVAYDPAGPRLAAELRAEGAALDRAQARAQGIAAGMLPFSPGDLLSDWERVCGLVASGSEAARVAAVLAKLLDIGRLSIAHFVTLAERMGYPILIVEPQPFRAGTSRAGDALVAEEAIWSWWVYVDLGARSYAGSDAVIEAVFNDLKPAHTGCAVIYVTSPDRVTEAGETRLTELDLIRSTTIFWRNT